LDTVGHYDHHSSSEHDNKTILSQQHLQQHQQQKSKMSPDGARQYLKVMTGSISTKSIQSIHIFPQESNRQKKRRKKKKLKGKEKRKKNRQI